MKRVSLWGAALILSVGAMPASAQGYMDEYRQGCQERNKAESFCSCALDAFSERLRKNDQRDLPRVKMNYEAELQSLLQDPALDEKKFSAACDLYDEAMAYDFEKTKLSLEYGAKGMVAPRDEEKALVDKKLAALAQREKLVESYGVKHQTAGAIVGGDICKYRADYRQKAKDLETPDVNGLYVQAARKLELRIPYTVIFKSGHKMCK